MKNKPVIEFWVFFVIWIAFGIAGSLLFAYKKDAAFKRKWFPWITIFAGVLFAVFTILVGMPLESLWLTAPAVIFISFLNIKFTKFCSHCGKTLYNSSWFTPMNYCAKCGKKLNDSK